MTHPTTPTPPSADMARLVERLREWEPCAEFNDEAADTIESLLAQVEWLDQEADADDHEITLLKEEVERLTAEREPLEIRPMDTAPKDATEILLSVEGAGSPAWIVAHWAQDLSGEEQPPFRGWFRRNAYGFREVGTTPLGWLPLPENRSWKLKEGERWCDRALAAEARCDALQARVGVLEEAGKAMLRRHSVSLQNWTQAAADAQRSGDRELFVQISNTALTALSEFPVEQARAALQPAQQETK